ncbi:MAG: hypothetical protein GX854_03430, partial [Clostridiales bacterium]|nr:hypothetical protein [Clostridiales bacterium]
VKNCVDDCCLPVKIFHGHVMDLIRKADVILIPRLISIRPGEYICPKFIGLPEMILNSIPGRPELLIMDFNAHSSLKKGFIGMWESGRKLGASPQQIKNALNKAKAEQKKYEYLLEKGFSTNKNVKNTSHNRVTSGRNLAAEPISRAKTSKEKAGKIGLIGHPYLIYDSYINMNICKKLAEQGYEIVFPEQSTQEEVDRACNRYPKKLFWSYGKRLLGSGLTMMEYGSIDGLILLTSFGCGIDSFIDELLIRANRREYKYPLTTITLDEHSGEAGFDTRLEAFIDMLEWRDRYDSHISSYGKSLYSGQRFV